MDLQTKKVRPAVDSFIRRFFTLIDQNRNNEVKDIVRKEKLLKIQDNLYYTILHVAAQTDNLEITKYLIDSGSEIDAQNYNGQTPLMLAIQCNREQIAELLITAGADIYKVNTYNQSAIQILRLTKQPSYQIHEIMAKKIINDWSHDPEKMIEKLLQLKWPLHQVIHLKIPALTRVMLQRKNDEVDAVDRIYKQTALHIAVEMADVENVKVLLEFDARVNVSDEAGRKPISYLYCKYSGYTHIEERYEIFKLLLDKGASILRKQEIYSVLEYGNKAAVRIMLNMRRDPVIVNYLGRRAVHYLAKNQNPGVIEQLRGNIFDVNSRDWYNQETPLIIAAAANNTTNAIEFLLHMGADVRAVDRFNKNALYYAISGISKDINVSEEYKKRRRESITTLLHWGVPINKEILNLKSVQSCHISTQPLQCHLTLQLLRGIPIFNLVNDRDVKIEFLKINDYKRKLTYKFREKLTLFHLLTMNQSYFEEHVEHDYDLICKLIDYIRCWGSNDYYCYFTILLQKRLSIPICDVELINFIRQLVYKIIKINYESKPDIVDKIVGYIELKDVGNLLKAYKKINKTSVK